MLLEIITPDQNLFNGEVKLIKVPGSKCSFEVLNKHAPIISTLEKGKIKIKTLSNEELFFDITGGLIEVKKDKVIVLAETV